MLEEKLLTWKYNHGRADVLGRIYEKYKNDLMTLATSLLFDLNSAEDVVHETFVTLVRSCGQMKIKKSLKGFLVTTVVNNIRNRNKANTRRQTSPLESAADIESNYDQPEIIAIFGEQSKHLAQSLQKLPYPQREVVTLRLFSDLKFRQIAESTNESINTIQGRYRYGLNTLRSLLNDEVQS